MLTFRDGFRDRSSVSASIFVGLTLRRVARRRAAGNDNSLTILTIMCTLKRAGWRTQDAKAPVSACCPRREVSLVENSTGNDRPSSPRAPQLHDVGCLVESDRWESIEEKRRFPDVRSTRGNRPNLEPTQDSSCENPY